MLADSRVETIDGGKQSTFRRSTWHELRLHINRCSTRTQHYRIVCCPSVAACVAIANVLPPILNDRADYLKFVGHGMNSTQYQLQFNSATAQGYRLVLVNGYAGAGGVDKYVAIWEKPNATVAPWVAKHRLTGAQYQSECQQLDGKRIPGQARQWICHWNYSTICGDLRKTSQYSSLGGTAWSH